MTILNPRNLLLTMITQMKITVRSTLTPSQCSLANTVKLEIKRVASILSQTIDYLERMNHRTLQVSASCPVTIPLVSRAREEVS